MASRDSAWSDQIRDLIEQVDRVRGESERVRKQADRAMKNPFWPERRRVPRYPSSEDTHPEHHSDV